MIIVTCPHCGDQIVIEQVNCNVFRHAVYRNTMKQIDPHTPKRVCDDLSAKGQVYGCAKPFTLKKEVAVPCDYI